MKPTIIPISNLLICLIPITAVILVFIKWKLEWKKIVYASIRMVSQLILIGYFLSYIFEKNSPCWTIIILMIMLTTSAWISLYSIKKLRGEQIKNVIIALLLGAVPVLLLITVFVLPHKSWYAPSFFIPLAGMVLSHAMNTISLTAERFESERKQKEINEARKISLNAALIPLINSFMAVGLVSLPGLMTGQILSGVSPLIAVRYQIVIMAMVMGSGGLSAALYLFRQKETVAIQNI